jgi:hypothetical protein
MQAELPTTRQSVNKSKDIETTNERVPLLQKDFMADVENNSKSGTPAAATSPAKNTTTPAAGQPSNTNVFNNITIINVTNTGDPGKNGTYMSFLIIVIGIVVSIITYRYSPDNINLSNWNDFCPNEDDNNDFYRSCKSNSAVLRISLAMTILFALQIIGTKIYTPYYDILWIVKSFLFSGLVIIFFFAVNGNAFDTGGYTWFARITGFFFLILQQVILLDLAYTWNESWVGYADVDGERGNYWLTILIIISLVMFLGGYAVMGLLYWQFMGCDNNIVIISLTVALTTIATILQLFFSENGSILTSAFMTAYAAYVCYSSVILNPSASCNPSLNSSYQTISAVSITGFVIFCNISINFLLLLDYWDYPFGDFLIVDYLQYWYNISLLLCLLQNTYHSICVFSEKDSSSSLNNRTKWKKY